MAEFPWPEVLCDLTRVGCAKTVAAIAAGRRGDDLWPALATDFGAWMMTRPDLWPAKPLDPTCHRVHIPTGEHSVFHDLPVEILLQILPLLSLVDLSSFQLLSRGISELVTPLLDEILWHHVHHGDFGWLLPVATVGGEVSRANAAAVEWYQRPKAARRGCILDSKDFPFSRFIPECLNSNSMRNRRRLWGIFKQFRALWETMGFDI
ncbi:hypothetical protein B0H19DRAFT_1148827 [Mycena capillaripes]|nr:hypothetical protein B0H19DRAFT_1148827 [Mycena capillaripes]